MSDYDKDQIVMDRQLFRAFLESMAGRKCTFSCGV